MWQSAAPRIDMHQLLNAAFAVNLPVWRDNPRRA
jgi:hypothetical protein